MDKPCRPHPSADCRPAQCPGDSGETTAWCNVRNRNPATDRRRFRQSAALGAGAWLSASCANRPATTGSGSFLAEHGFWDYTTPGAGGMGAFQWDDYDRTAAF